MIAHSIRLRNGTVIYLPTSIPQGLLPFVDTAHLVNDQDLAAFKSLLKEKNGKP